MFDFQGLRKSIAVAITTLLLIPVLFLMPNVYDNFANRYGVIGGIMPLSLLLFMAASTKPSEFSFFIIGLMLIGVGILFFAAGDFITAVAQKALETKRISKNEFKEMTEGMSLWLYSIPVVDIGIGINLISKYLSIEEPNT